MIFIMILKGDVQKALQALIEQEQWYWQEHNLQTVEITNPWNDRCHGPTALWEGYHWQYVRVLVQTRMWWDLKHHIKGLRGTHVKDQILYLIELNAPRLYRELWGENSVLINAVQ